MSQHFYYPPTDVSIAGTVVVDQGTSPWIVEDSAAEASLASIDASIDVNLSTRASEATLLAFSNKTAAGFVPEAFDETVMTYVGATTDISTVTYKLATVTVAVLTMSYDGSNRLIGVVKT